jgi:glycosyltransferase involved in cell wall biosynthesis
MPARTILHLIDTGGPGGAETIFLELVRHFDGPTWRSIAVVPSRDWLHGALAGHGIEPVLVPTDGAYDAGYLFRLAALARREKVSLIQTHLLTTGVYGGMVGRLLGLPVVSTFHGQVDVPTGGLSAVKARIMDRRRSRAVFVSESLRRSTLQRLPLNATRTRVVHNGIDTFVYGGGPVAELRRELGVDSGDILVAAVGNVRASKDYGNLLRAAALLRERSPRYRFLVIGDTRSGTLIDELLELRATLRLDDAVRFLGFRDDVVSLLGASDVFALSSDQEGFSLATVQAMASGVPVVATRCGGPEEIVTHERDGLLVPVADATALAGAIERAALDAELRARLTAAALHTVAARFSLRSMTEAYGGIYDEVLGTGWRAPAQRTPSAAAGRGREAV